MEYPPEPDRADRIALARKRPNAFFQTLSVPPASIAIEMEGNVGSFSNQGRRFGKTMPGYTMINQSNYE
jgi:hypothetical protein